MRPWSQQSALIQPSSDSTPLHSENEPWKGSDRRKNRRKVDQFTVTLKVQDGRWGDKEEDLKKKKGVATQC